MEHEEQTPVAAPRALIVAIIVLAVAGAVVYRWGIAAIGGGATVPSEARVAAAIPDTPAPTLEIPWGDLGAKLVETGVIDEEAFLDLYIMQPDRAAEARKLLAPGAGTLVMGDENAPLVLNLLWALGLGNGSKALRGGPMVDPRYGGAHRFASTGGWPLARGNVMDHYAAHALVPLTADGEALVARVAQNVYRPCCDNSTYFPDCNHGMAMLGLLSLLASSGADEPALYRAALAANELWFPSAYDTIRQHFAAQGIAWDAVDPRQAVARDVASGSGFARIEQALTAPRQSPGGGSSCGV